MVGGLSGIVMGSANLAISNASDLVSGNKLIENGQSDSVISISEMLSEFEDKNQTGDETYSFISKTHKELLESLKKTGGTITTAQQKKTLAILQRVNTAAIFKPMIYKSAANTIANAEAVAERINEYGYTDSKGNKITVTAEEIRSGYDAKKPKSIINALKTNIVKKGDRVIITGASAVGNAVTDTIKLHIL